jgi:hypothetical protein
MLDFGAERADVGRGAAPGAVLADPEGNAFRVVEDGETHRDPGPIAALSLHSADPERDVAFWAMITGWERRASTPGATALRHAAQRPVRLPLARARRPLRHRVLHPGPAASVGTQARSVVRPHRCNAVWLETEVTEEIDHRRGAAAR